MRVAFRADAGIEQGSGHVVRTLTLAREFQKEGHDVCLISNINEIPWLSDMVRKSDVIWQDCIPHALNTERILKESFDFLVIDSYLIPHDSINAAAGIIPIMAIVDNDMRNINSSFVLDQNLGAKSFDVSSLTTQLIGPTYSLVRQEIRDIRRESSSLINRHGLPSLLVMIGGTDPTNLSVSLSRLLRDVDLEFDIYFVTTESNVNEIAKFLPRNRDNILTATSEIHEILKHVDIAISAAGTSTLDLSCIGIPTIYVSVASNQDAALEMVANLEVGIALGQGKDLEKSHKDLINSVERCAYDTSLRETLFQNSQNLVDGWGARRVAEQVTNKVC